MTRIGLSGRPTRRASVAPQLRGKAAVVTGAGRGIGEAVALAFANQGARLVLVARTLSELEKVAERVREAGSTAVVVSADVSNRADVAGMVKTAIQAYDRIDILANVAGVYGPIGNLWEVDPDAWVQAMQVNLFGTFFCCRAVLPRMTRLRKGKIINFSGGGATSPLPCFTAYGVSKTAVVRLTETLAEEVKAFNIQVNAIAPGAVDTKLQDAVMSAGKKAGEVFHRIRRLRETGEGGVPREVPAALAVFLASPASNGLTGKLIAAPHDGWESWDAGRIAELMQRPWLTLRRLDPFTLGSVADKKIRRT